MVQSSKAPTRPDLDGRSFQGQAVQRLALMQQQPALGGLDPSAGPWTVGALTWMGTSSRGKLCSAWPSCRNRKRCAASVGAGHSSRRPT